MEQGRVRFVDTADWHELSTDFSAFGSDRLVQILHQLDYDDAEDLYGIAEALGPEEARVSAVCVLGKLFFVEGQPIDNPWRPRVLEMLKTIEADESETEHLRFMAGQQVWYSQIQEIMHARKAKPE